MKKGMKNADTLDLVKSIKVPVGGQGSPRGDASSSAKDNLSQSSSRDRQDDTERDIKLPKIV